ncbi:DUF134 domain-containing protein [Planctomycetota bacterium]
MARPHKEKGIKEPPRVQSFKPTGIPMRFLERVSLTLDEFEAIRLADHEGLEHKEASERMGISRSTFTRLIDKARKKVGEALVEVKELFIEGGNVHFKQNLIRCLGCGYILSLGIAETPPEKCPECGEANLVNLAQAFGHGRCCGGGGRGHGGGFRHGRGGRR